MKTKMKKLIALLLTIMMMVNVLPISALAETEGISPPWPPEDMRTSVSGEDKEDGDGDQDPPEEETPAVEVEEQDDTGVSSTLKFASFDYRISDARTGSYKLSLNVSEGINPQTYAVSVEADDAGKSNDAALASKLNSLGLTVVGNDVVIPPTKDMGRLHGNVKVIVTADDETDPENVVKARASARLTITHKKPTLVFTPEAIELANGEEPTEVQIKVQYSDELFLVDGESVSYQIAEVTGTKELSEKLKNLTVSATGRFTIPAIAQGDFTKPQSVILSAQAVITKNGGSLPVDTVIGNLSIILSYVNEAPTIALNLNELEFIENHTGARNVTISVADLEDKEAELVIDIDTKDSGILSTTLSGKSLSVDIKENVTGSAIVKAIVTDTSGAQATADLHVRIQPNKAPLMAPKSFETNEDRSLEIGSLVDIFGDKDEDGDSVNYSIGQINDAGKGELTLEDNKLIYTPTYPKSRNDVGETDSFIIEGDDGFGGVSNSTFTIQINNVNDAPYLSELGTQTNTSLTTDEDQPLDVDMTGVFADYDLDDELNFFVKDASQDDETGAFETENGTIEFDLVTGSFVFMPKKDYNGMDAFTIVCQDKGNLTCELAFSVEVKPVNDPPEISIDPEIVQIDENDYTPQVVHLNFSDIDDSDENAIPATVTWSIEPDYDDAFDIEPDYENNTLIITAKRNKNTAESVSIVILADDGSGAETAIGRKALLVNINKGNFFPDMREVEIVNMDEDGTYTLNLNVPPFAFDRDVEEGDELTYTLVELATHGVVTITDGILTYTPPKLYYGMEADSFQIIATDSLGVESEPCVFTINIAHINHEPQLIDVSRARNTFEDTAIEHLDMNDFTEDIDQIDTLRFELTTPPMHGTVELDESTGVFAYIPGQDYNGPDSFIITAIDDYEGGSAHVDAEFTVLIENIDDEVELQNISHTYLKQFPETFAYPMAPLTGASCPDTVAELNQDPALVDNWYEIKLTGVGENGLRTFETELGGLVSIEDDNETVLYIPPLNYDGQDFFTYYVERAGVVSEATATITLTPRNYAPNFYDFTQAGQPHDEKLPFVMEEDEADGQKKTITFKIEDDKADFMELTVFAMLQDNASIALLNAPVITKQEDGYTVTVTPKKDMNGTGKVTLIASDGIITSTQELHIEVTPVNDPPVATNINLTLVEDQNLTNNVGTWTYTYLLRDASNWSDVDGTPFSETVFDFDATQLSGMPGVVSCEYNQSTGIITFVFEEDFNTQENGPLNLKYQIIDKGCPGDLNPQSSPLNVTSQGNITIAITPVNDVPLLTLEQFSASYNPNTGVLTMNEDSEGDAPEAGLFRFRFSDPDTLPEDYAAKLRITASSSNSALVNTAGLVLVTPINNEPGTGTLDIRAIKDAFTQEDATTVVTLTVSDGELYATIVIEVVVLPVNDMPVAVDDKYSVDDGVETVLNILDNDFDIDGDELSAIIADQPSNGTLVVTVDEDGNQVITYTANLGYEGEDSFTYVIDDGQGKDNSTSELATVTLIVTKRPNWPRIEQISPIVIESPKEEVPDDIAFDISMTDIPVGPYTLTMRIDSLTQPMLINGISLDEQSTTEKTLTFSGVNPGPGLEVRVPLAIDLAMLYNGSAYISLDLSVQTDGETKADATSFRLTVDKSNDAPTSDDIYMYVNLDDTVSKIIYGDESAIPPYGPYVHDNELPVDLVLKGVDASAAKYGWVEADTRTGEITYHAFDDMLGTGSWYDSFSYTVVDGGGADAGDLAATTAAMVNVTVLHVERKPVAIGDMFLARVGDNGKPFSFSLDEILNNDYDYDMMSIEDPMVGQLIHGENCRITSVKNADGEELEFQIIDGNLVFQLDDDASAGQWQTYTYTIETRDTDGLGWSESSPATIGVGYLPGTGGEGGGGPFVLPAMVLDRDFIIEEDCGLRVLDISDAVVGYPQEGTLSFAFANPSDANLVDIEARPTTKGTDYALLVTPRSDMNTYDAGASSVTLEYTVDNGALSNTGIVTIEIRPVNDRPVFDANDHHSTEAEMANLETDSNRFSISIGEFDEAIGMNTIEVKRGEPVVHSIAAYDIDNSFAQLKLAADSSNIAIADSLAIDITKGLSEWTLSIPTRLGTDAQSGDYTVIRLTLSDGIAYSYAQFAIKLATQDPPMLLSDEIEIHSAEDASAYFVVVKDGDESEMGNNPNRDKLHIEVSSVMQGGTNIVTETSADGKTITTTLGTLRVSDGRGVSFEPKKDYFMIENEDDPIIISYYLKDEIDLQREPSEVGTLNLTIYAVNDIPVIGRIPTPIKVQEDTWPSPTPVVTFQIKDVDRGYTRENNRTIKDAHPLLTLTYHETNETAQIPCFVNYEWSSDTDDLVNHSVTVELSQVRDAFHIDANKPAEFTVTLPHAGFDVSGRFAVIVSGVNDLPFYTNGAEDNQPAPESRNNMTLVYDMYEDIVFSKNYIDLFYDIEDGHDLFIQSLNPSTFKHGIAINNGDGSISFRPEQDYFTPTEGALDADYGGFDIVVSDKEGGTISAHVRLNIQPVNDPPIVRDRTISGGEDAHALSIDLSSLISNPKNQENDEIIAINLVPPIGLAKGLPMQDPANPERNFDSSYTYDEETRILTFYPQMDWAGSSVFTFAAQNNGGDKTDGLGIDTSTSATVTFNVSALNDAPFIAFETGSGDAWRTDIYQTDVVWTMREDEIKAFTFRLWDLDSPVVMLTSNVPESDLFPTSNNSGMTRVNENGTYTFRPARNQNGEALITFKVDDGIAFREATVRLIVLPVNDSPVVTSATDTLTFLEDGAMQNGRMTVSDVESIGANQLRLAVTGSTKNDGSEAVGSATSETQYVDDLGTLTIDATAFTADTPIAFHFVPKPNVFGTHTYALAITDGGDPHGTTVDDPDSYKRPVTVTHMLTVTVNPVNDKSIKVGLPTALPQHKGGEDILLSFPSFLDFPEGATTEETGQSALEYYYQESSNGSAFSDYKPLTTEYLSGMVNGRIPVPENTNIERYVIRVFARDTGATGETVDNAITPTIAANALYSDDYHELVFKIDSFAPTATVSAIEPWYNAATHTNANFTIAVTDPDAIGGPNSHTGVKSVEYQNSDDYQLDGTEAITGNAPNTVYNGSFAADKTGTYTFVLTDVANNVRRQDVTLNIDRFAPIGVSFTPAVDTNATAKDPDDKLTVTLNNQDDAEANVTTGDAKSGLATAQYQVTQSTIEPTSGWITMESDANGTLNVDINDGVREKGVYYVHARITDVAGNVTTTVSPAYELLNNAPVIQIIDDQVVAEDSDGIVIPINVSDLDRVDIDNANGTLVVSFAFDDPLLEEHATIAYAMQPNNRAIWNLSLTPVPDHFLTGPVTFTITADDGAGISGGETRNNSIQSITFTYNIAPVNDAPTKPVITSVTNITQPNLPTNNQFRGGEDTMRVVFTECDDVHWVQETEKADLTYQVYTSIDGNTNWTPQGSALTYGACNGIIEFTVPANTNTANFAVKVVVSDDGKYGLGMMSDPIDIKTADSDAVTNIRIDSNLPSATATQNPVADTNGSVIITYTLRDLLDGASGIYTGTGAGAIAIADITADGRAISGITSTGNYNAGTGTITATVNRLGTYEISFRDIVGHTNTFAYSVTNIDWLPPLETRHVASGSEMTALDTENPIVVELDFADDESQPTASKATGVAVKRFMISRSTVAPTDYSAWTNVTDDKVDFGQTQTPKGTWYLYVLSQDAVGNQTVNSSGPYTLRNNQPQIILERIELFEDNMETAESVEGGVSATVNLTVFDKDGDTLSLSSASPVVVDSTYVTSVTAGTTQTDTLMLTLSLVQDAYTKDGEITFDVTITDSDPDTLTNTAQKIIPMTIVPVNDTPLQPGPALFAANAAFKVGDDVDVSWVTSLEADKHWTEIETPNDNLNYQLQYSHPTNANEFAGGDNYFTEKGVQSYVFAAPTGDVGEFRVQMRTWDDGRTTPSGNPGDPLLYSAYVISENYARLDNTPPAIIVSGIDQASWYNFVTAPTGVPFKVNVIDRDGTSALANDSHTGVAEVTTGALIPEDGSPELQSTDGFDGTYEADFIGFHTADNAARYVFNATDKVGNTPENPTYVNVMLDRNAPTATINTGDTEDRYAWSQWNVTIDTNDDVIDDEAFIDDGKSGIDRVNSHAMVYASTGEGARIPMRSDADRIEFDLGQRAKGTYRVEAVVVDQAGNERIVELGEYVLHNNPPTFGNLTATLYEDNSSDAKSEDRTTFHIDVPVKDLDDDLLTLTVVGDPTDTAIESVDIQPHAKGSERIVMDVTLKQDAYINSIKTISLEMVDDDVDEQGKADDTFSLTITPVNDVPKAPNAPSFTGDNDYFKAGESIPFSWTILGDSDKHWDYHETVDEALNFTAKFTGDSGEHTIAAGSTDFVYIAPTIDIGRFGVELRTNDDGRAVLGEAAGAVLSSDFIPSTNTVRIDNTAPVFTTSGINENQWYNRETALFGVPFKLTVVDKDGRGSLASGSHTGVVSVENESANGILVRDEWKMVGVAPDTEFNGDFKATNGSYRWIATDLAGNVTNVHQVQVKLDRIEPIIEVDGALFDIPTDLKAGGSMPINLGFEDPDTAGSLNSSTDAVSGLDAKQYYVDGNPTTSSPAWVDYSGSFDLAQTQPKGIWYVHARATDKAGNMTQFDSDAIRLLNNPPTLVTDKVEVYEDGTADPLCPDSQEDPSKRIEQTVTLDLFVDDLDPGDIAGLTLRVAPNGVDGEVVTNAIVGARNANGTFPITIALGKDKFSEAGVSINLELSDGDGYDPLLSETVQCSLTVVVIPVNDNPSTPRIDVKNARNEVQYRWFREGDTVEILFDASTDIHGGQEETTQALLTYMPYMALDGNWSAVLKGARLLYGSTGIAGISFIAPEGNSDAFGVQIDVEDEGGLRAVSNQILYMKLDNTSPTVLPSQTPTADTKDLVEVRFRLNDPNAGATGIDRRTIVVTDVNRPELGELSYSMEDNDTVVRIDVQNNGTYKCVVLDMVGNEGEGSIVVDNIDKLNPKDTEFGPNGATINAHAQEGNAVTLTYADADETGEDKSTGIPAEKREYAISVDRETLPAEPWSIYDGTPINLSQRAKGTYYIHTRSTDAVGNVTINVSEPFVLKNNTPTFDMTSDSRFEDNSSTPLNPSLAQTTVITIPVSDIDGDELTVALMADAYDTNIIENVVLTGIVNDSFDMAVTFVPNAYAANGTNIYLILSDGDESGTDSATNELPFVLTITPVNDYPTTASITSVANGSVGEVANRHMFKQGDEMIVAYINSSDVHWSTDETSATNLLYQLQYQLDGGVWVNLGEAQTYTSTFRGITAPAGNSDNFVLRVMTTDDGSLGAGLPTASALSVESEPYQPMKLDNTLPLISDPTQQPEESIYTNGDVTIDFTVTDTGNGATGVYEVSSSDNTSVISGGADAYRAVAEQNGTYTFDAFDLVQNAAITKSITISNIDKLRPLATTFDIEGVERFALDTTNPLLVTLGFDDAPDNILNAKSGINGSMYLLSNDLSFEPDENSDWEEYTGPIDMSVLEKGTWTIWALSIDNAGNFTINKSLPYELLNNRPELKEVPARVDMVEGDSAYSFNIGVFDKDSADAGNLMPILSWMHPEEGADPLPNGAITIEQIEASAVEGATSAYRVTIVAGSDVFTNGDVSVTLAVDDRSGAENATETGSFALNITPVNDNPQMPLSAEIELPQYKGGDDVNFSWTVPYEVDEHWVTETENGNITYEAQYSTDDNVWTEIASVAGELKNVFTAPYAINSDNFRIRVRSVDDRNFGNGNGLDTEAAKFSDWRTSDPVKLDNTAPFVSSNIDLQELWTNLPESVYEFVSLTLNTHDYESGEDSVAGATGIATITYTDITRGIDPVTVERDGESGSNTFRITNNGTYEFVIIDNVGNTSEHSVTITQIDRIAPLAAIFAPVDFVDQVAHGDLEDLTVRLTATDAEGTLDNGISGIASVKYQISSDSTLELDAMSDGWIDYDEGIGIDLTENAKGTWYIYVLSTDNAGNSTVTMSDGYNLENNQPLFIGTVDDVELSEDDDGEGVSTSFLVNIFDRDAADAELLTLSASWSHHEEAPDPLPEGAITIEDAGQSEIVEGATRAFRVTITAAQNVFTSNPIRVSLTINNEGDESNANTNATSFDVTIKAVNDAPMSASAPMMDVGQYKLDDPVNISWVSETDMDEHWKTETPDAQMVYEAQYTLSENADTNAPDDSADWVAISRILGEEAMVFDAPEGNSAFFRFRVRAVDNGELGNGTIGEPLTSNWVASENVKLDNRAPGASHITTVEQSQLTNEDVLITYTLTDGEEAFQTGINPTSIRVTDVTPNRTMASSVTMGDYNEDTGEITARVTQNGEYQIAFEDAVGNMQTYTATVSNIDKLNPQDTTFDRDGGEELAFTEFEVTLHYADQAADGLNTESQIGSRMYQLVNDATEPNETSDLWQSYDGPIDMSVLEKGSWTIWAMSTDNVGNITINASRPYHLLNNQPTFDVLAKEQQTTEDLADEEEDPIPYTFGVKVSDKDGADQLRLSLLAVMADEAGERVIPNSAITVSEGNIREDGTEFTVAINLPQDHFSTDGVIIRLTLDDGSGEDLHENTESVLLRIDGENDTPRAPLGIDFSEIMYPAGKGDENVLISWVFDPSGDEHWITETPEDELLYEVQYSLAENPSSDSDWQPIDTLPNANSVAFEAPEDNSYFFRVRVRTIDNGKLGESNAALGETLISEWTVSENVQLDSTAPNAVTDNQLKSPTNTDDIITLTGDDHENRIPGVTHIQSVVAKDITNDRDDSELEPCEVSFAGSTGGLRTMDIMGISSMNSSDSNLRAMGVDTNTAGDYTMIVSKNGLYQFTITDHVGNVTVVDKTIDMIDKLAPSITATPANGTTRPNVKGGITVNLSFIDAPKTIDYIMSDIAQSWIFVDSSSANPASDAVGWRQTENPKNASWLVNTRGNFYVHAKTIDNAGNETIQTFGPFIITNNDPVASDVGNLHTVMNSPVSGTGTWSDLDGDTLSVTGITSANPSVIPTSGVNVNFSSDGTITVDVTPASDTYSVNPILVTVNVSDGNGGSTSFTFTVRVDHINTAPTASGGFASVECGKRITNAFRINAGDGADREFANTSFGYSVDTQARHGIISVDSNGEVSFRADNNYTGTDSGYILASEMQTFDGNVNPSSISDPDVRAIGDGLLARRVQVEFEIRPTPPPLFPDDPNVIPEPIPTRAPGGAPGLEIPTGLPSGDSDGGRRQTPISQIPAFQFATDVDFDELGIPLGSLPTFASSTGLTQQEYNELLTEINQEEDPSETYLFSQIYLEKIFDMPYQMVLPIDFDAIDWITMPESGLEFPIVAKAETIVGHAYMRQVIRELEDGTEEEGYQFDIVFEPEVFGDSNFAAIHFVRQLRDLILHETQYMEPSVFDGEHVMHFNEFIPKELLTGKQYLYIAVPVVYSPEGHEIFARDELTEIEPWHDMTMELQLMAPYIPPFVPELSGPRLAYDPEHAGWYSEDMQEAPIEEEEDIEFFGEDQDDFTIVDADEDDDLVEFV